MTDLSTIHVIPIYGKNNECPTWSKKFPAKDNRYSLEPVSVPSLVKIEFRQCALKKNQDLEIWITELEELGSSITDNRFMIHILNNMTSDYDLQLEIMEKRVNDKMYQLTIDEIRDD
jgi:hypothetical protein